MNLRSILGTTPGTTLGTTGPKSRWPTALAIAGLVLVLGGYNYSIREREQLLANGQVVRLALAPRDPRSLLTGDYMTLNYVLARDIDVSLRSSFSERNTAGRAGSADKRLSQAAHDGYAIVRLDERGVAQFVRRQDQRLPLAAGEWPIKYRFRQRRVGIGTNAYFFEEGSAPRFEPARFGEYRVDAGGNLLLVRLLGERLDAL